jgi:hypothetical protein
LFLKTHKRLERAKAKGQMSAEQEQGQGREQEVTAGVKLKLFDRTEDFKCKVVVGGGEIKQVVTRYPTDAEWCDRQRRMVAIRRSTKAGSPSRRSCSGIRYGSAIQRDRR